MKNRTFWIGLVAVFIVMQVYNFLVHGLWLENRYQELSNIFRSEAEMAGMMHWMFFGSAVGVLIFAIIFVRGREGGGVMEGVRYGALIGTFYSVPYALDQYVVWPLPLDLALTWAVTGIIGFVIGGALFAAIYKPA
jgi:hypothetical protein